MTPKPNVPIEVWIKILEHILKIIKLILIKPIDWDEVAKELIEIIKLLISHGVLRDYHLLNLVR